MLEKYCFFCENLYNFAWVREILYILLCNNNLFIN